MDIFSKHHNCPPPPTPAPRTATVKPSDRRIDFDIETLLSFLERRKLSSSLSSSSLSSSLSSSSLSGWLPESAPASLALRGRQ